MNGSAPATIGKIVVNIAPPSPGDQRSTVCTPSLRCPSTISVSLAKPGGEQLTGTVTWPLHSNAKGRLVLEVSATGAYLLFL